jgi:hypothetical protein
VSAPFEPENQIVYETLEAEPSFVEPVRNRDRGSGPPSRFFVFAPTRMRGRRAGAGIQSERSAVEVTAVWKKEVRQ